MTMNCTECGQPLSKPAEMAEERDIDNRIALTADPEYVQKNVPSDNAICSKCGRPYKKENRMVTEQIMTTDSDERHRRIEQFAKYLRLMGLRRRNFVVDDDCFAIFEESAPAGIDAPHAAESAAVKAEAPANGGPAPDEGDAANPPSPERPSKRPLRYVQFAFGEDCFYVDLSNRALLPHEAETILQQRAGIYWAKDRPNLPWIRTNWKDVVRFNPLQKGLPVWRRAVGG